MGSRSHLHRRRPARGLSRRSRSWRGVLRQPRAQGDVRGGTPRRCGARGSARAGLQPFHRPAPLDRGRAGHAVAASRTWSQVAVSARASPAARAARRSRVMRPGSVSTSSTSGQRTRRPTDLLTRLRFDHDHLPRSGSMLAAAWLTLCGYEVSWPLEPCRYDLVAAQGRRGARGSRSRRLVPLGRAAGWSALSDRRSPPQTAYDPDDIDYFFIIDGDLDYYLIPVTVRRRASARSTSPRTSRSGLHAAAGFSPPEPSPARPGATRCRPRRTPRPGSA